MQQKLITKNKTMPLNGDVLVIKDQSQQNNTTGGQQSFEDSSNYSNYILNS